MISDLLKDKSMISKIIQPFEALLQITLKKKPLMKDLQNLIMLLMMEQSKHTIPTTPNKKETIILVNYYRRPVDSKSL